MYFLESKNITSLEQVDLEVEQSNAKRREVTSISDSSSFSDYKNLKINVLREINTFNMQ